MGWLSAHDLDRSHGLMHLTKQAYIYAETDNLENNINNVLNKCIELCASSMDIFLIQVCVDVL